MLKYDLLHYADSIVRVLEIQEEKVLVIDCLKQTMPVWIDHHLLKTCQTCSVSALLSTAKFAPIDSLSTEQKKVMHQRYTLIAPVLPCLSDEKQRSKVISAISQEYAVSKQTIRKYLCQYLSYLDLAALAPRKRSVPRELTADEKNMRWALNKFFYTRNKNSLMTAYTMMLKEKYSDPLGQLSESYPSFYQFRYFYRKTKKLQNYYISRNGLSHYQRNTRPLVGDGIQEFAPSVGTAMLDSTICDIYLVDEVGRVVGRPILTACIDAYSGLCCGYYLSWEGGVYSLRGMMLNVIADKVDWCRQFGIVIEEQDWPCHQLPAVLVTDMGREYQSENFEQIAELGVTVVNLPPYRPELKGMVEKFFDLIQDSYKKHLRGKGVIEPDYQEGGAPDYRKHACLTLREFEKVLLYCIIYYNSQRIIDKFPYSQEMITAGIKPYSSAIWNWSVEQLGANLIDVDLKDLVRTLLPRATGTFTRYGLKVNQLRYHCDGFAEQYLKGGNAVVAYNPEDVTSVWLLDNGNYTEFQLIESRFYGKDLTQVQDTLVILTLSLPIILFFTKHDALQNLSMFLDRSGEIIALFINRQPKAANLFVWQEVGVAIGLFSRCRGWFIFSDRTLIDLHPHSLPTN